MLHKNRVVPSFFLLIIAVLILFPAAALAWSGKVVHIADGDTITVLRDGDEVRVRLYGIDTPESDQPFGSRAERFARETIGDNKVEIVAKDEDRYGRTVALVYIEGDGECLNEELVREGYAWVYNRYCKIRDCNSWRELQDQARDVRAGLWEQEDPVPPWDWRHSR